MRNDKNPVKKSALNLTFKMSYYIPPSTTQCSVIRSRTRTDVPEAYASVRSVVDLVDQEYCDPHDPCCVNRDPEVFLHETVLRQSARKVCAPKNPLHFEYNIIHRFKLRKILQMASERQQNEDLTPEQLEEIRRLEEEEDASRKLQPKVNQSRAANMKVSSNPQSQDGAPPPPGKVSEDSKDLQNHLQGLTNLALTHEVALNKDFKLRKMQELEKTKSQDPLTQQIQLAQDAKDRYWARMDHVLMKKDLKGYKHVVIDVLSTMKQALQGTILPHNWTMREKIEQELNMRKITKQIDGDAFDFGYYVDFILDTLAALCCPIRDEAVVEIRDIPMVSKQLRKILDLVDVINLDMANFVLSQSRAHTMQNCILYERNKFANYVEAQYRAGRDPLRVTRDWIRRHSTGERGFSEAMSYAFLEVLEWEDDKEWPETLALDWHRFPQIREEIRRVTVIGTIVTCVYEYALTLLMDSTAGEGEGSGVGGVGGFEKEQLCLLKNLRLMSKLREELDPLLGCEDMKDSAKFQEALRLCGEYAARIVDDHRLAELCEGIQESEKLKIQQIVLPLTNLNHDVRKNYYEAVKQWFLELAKEDGRAQIHTPEKLRSVGQLIIVPVTDMIRLTMYNRGVFDVLYREIFEGNCKPPTMFPPTPDEDNADEPVVLDANKYGQEEEDDVVLDENIAMTLAKLRGFKGRSMVYRRSRVDPRTKPMFEADGTPIIPPEKQPEYVPKQLTAIEQKHLDEYILAHEPTLEEDYEGVYQANVGEPDWMFGYTTEQLLQIMERENLINANKLRRIKDRMNQEILHQRVADNLPVFYKLWGKDFGGLEKEFCRLQRIYEKGMLKLPPGSTDEPSGKREFPKSCQPPPPPPPELPKVNQKGEKLIYAGEGKQKFGVDDALPPQKCEFDFEGVAKALADVKDTDPENFLTQPNPFSRGEGDQETALDKLLRNIPKPDPHWRMLDFKIRIPRAKTNRFKWSRMMQSMAKIHGNNPYSPINQFGSPMQRQTPTFTSTWAPPQENQIYTGARSRFGGEDAPTSNQTVMQMAIPLMLGKTAIIAKADKPQMPLTSDIPPIHGQSMNASKLRKASGAPGKKTAGVGDTMVRFPMVSMPRRQMTSFDPLHRQRRMPISEKQKLMMNQQEQRSSARGNMLLRPPQTNLKRRFSFDWRQGH